MLNGHLSASEWSDRRGVSDELHENDNRCGQRGPGTGELIQGPGNPLSRYRRACRQCSMLRLLVAEVPLPSYLVAPWPNGSGNLEGGETSLSNAVAAR